MRQQRPYSVFVKEGKKWTRVTPLALPLNSARRFFQGILLEGACNGLNMALRPAEEDYANQGVYLADKKRLFHWLEIPTAVVTDHVANAEGELVDAGQIEVELEK